MKEGKVRVNRVLLSLTDEELKLLTEQSQKLGLPVGTYARIQLFQALRAQAPDQPKPSQEQSPA